MREISMTRPSLRYRFGLVAAALIAGAALLPQASSQMLVTPSFVPMGVASNGNSSTAWFYESASGRAMACTTAPTATGLSPIQCVTARLPRTEP